MTRTELAHRAAALTLATGGATLAADGTSPVTGYAVALPGCERVVTPDRLPAELVTYLQDHADDLSRPGAHLGTWAHDGSVYLDVTLVLSDLAPALNLARSSGQLAIFSLSDGREISLQVSA